MNFRLSAALLALLTFALPLAAQEDGEAVTVHGSVQADALFPEEDAAIGAEKFREKLLGNLYANVGLFSKYVDAGLRAEYLQHPLPGFENQFKGWGLPNFYATAKYKGFQLTGGTFYEQFGSGFILRTYEERSLGIDNSILGGRIKVDALPGVRFTALGGVQRRYWDWGSLAEPWKMHSGATLYGADAEWDLQQHISALADNDIVWTLGASWVLKDEKYDREDRIYTVHNDSLCYLNVPRRVNAFDFRTQFYKGGLNLLAEVALKGPDPSFDNNYTYANGSAAMLSASYSQTGWSAQLQAKRSENFSFRSRRAQEGISSFINNMPAFAYQHTYALAAMYPYATQTAPGEWAYTGNFAYKFAGRYAPKFRLNLSHIRGIKREGTWQSGDRAQYGTDGLKTKFFGHGDLYYQDINLMYEQKFSKTLSLNAMYMSQRYNKTVIEGEGGMINANILVVEPKWKISHSLTLRGEMQYLQTNQDKGDWLYGLVELSVLPYVMVGASDQWNLGGDGTHYYMVNVTGNFRNNRLMLGYGRTRAGYNCSGGVCRYVPATRGLTLSYNYNF